jgi:AcrR family transcriptional regulator
VVRVLNMKMNARSQATARPGRVAAAGDPRDDSAAPAGVPGAITGAGEPDHAPGTGGGSGAAPVSPAARPAPPGPDTATAGLTEVPPASRGRETRERIQRIALELFAEQGYEKTSLREIAQRLEVTKAALYYHFQSKEDIVRSLIDDYMGQIDALIDWGRGQPKTPQARREILRRYVQIVASGSAVFRMLQQNQAAVNSLEQAKHRGHMFQRRMGGLIEVLTPPGAGEAEKVRAAMCLGGVSVGWMFCADQAGDRDRLGEVILSVACEVARCAPPGRGAAQPA